MLIGIVGKANVGKSTFFKALTLSDILIANYPFATIAPNRGIGFVKIDCADTFFKTQCSPRFGACISHHRFVPVDVADVAGLVPGAHEGHGLGNQFLSDLNEADALINVIDAAGATNEKGEAAEPGSFDPADDIKFLEHELDMWYYQIIMRGWDRFARTVKQEGKEACKAIAKQLSGLRVTEDMVKNAIKELDLPVDVMAWTDDNLKSIASYLRKKSKPMVIAANKMDVPIAGENIEKLKKEFPELMIIGCSADSELALKEANKKGLISYEPGSSAFEMKQGLTEQQKKALEFIQKNVLSNGSTGVQDVLNKAVFDLLKYIAVYPVAVKLGDKDGNILPDCFLMPPSSTALEFAYRVHADIGKSFIKAMDLKRKMPVGKDYKLKHLDVIEIMAGR